jgi:hypothetical protein
LRPQPNDIFHNLLEHDITFGRAAQGEQHRRDDDERAAELQEGFGILTTE